MSSKVKDGLPQRRNADSIKERYVRLCERIHISSDHFSFRFEPSTDALTMSFRKDPNKIMGKQALFGKNIIITDNTDWTTGDIFEAILDRWQVEDWFRLRKDDDLFCVQPIRHGTDSKIRYHRLFAYFNFGGCVWSLSGPDF